MEIEIRNLQFDTFPGDVMIRSARETAALIGFDLDLLSLVIVDDERMRELNLRFRNIDRTTDVISFEADRDEDEASGEIIISLPTARRQAQAAGHDTATELAWLVSHGLLHVAGMDDTTEDELAAMIDLQSETMKRMGLQVHP
ncbi:MAG: rRNA maturation RNase YbeY [Acidobacteriota bacterium]|nr:rRNA maturation RNase YbeY [Acidobacteriota bacterium]